MKWNQTHIPTLKESPAEAEIPSHKLMLRAGLMRKLAGGIYTFLPLGLRAYEKVERIVREEMNRAGAIEIRMPALQPKELWQRGPRWDAAQRVMFAASPADGSKFAPGGELVLGPTHEEVITSLAADEIHSYRQLPKNFYQIQTKFRNEIRPRFGLMRAKEFVMKDGYSFDATEDGAVKSYEAMRAAYQRVFERCGFGTQQLKCVWADSGVMGGKYSQEFMVTAECGENEIAFCEKCSYVANVEKAQSKLARLEDGEAPANVGKFPTPGVKTIEDLTKPPFLVAADRQVKTLIFIADSKPVLVLMRGDHPLNEVKLAAATGAIEFRAAREDEIVPLMGARPGSLGAVGKSGVPIYADEALRGRFNMVTGANEDGFHLRGVCVERDIKVTKWADLRSVAAGEPCPECAAPLRIQRAIELGHIFILGTKYSEKLGANYLDEKGQSHPCVMGCYGIGVTRTLAAVIECFNDKDGIVWPMAVAPFHVCISLLDPAKEASAKIAQEIHDALEREGVEVILDDRDERPGFKFKDADLIGFPIRVTIGEKSLAKGGVEVKQRATGEMKLLPPAEAVKEIVAAVRR
ncbi:MAG: proline--tRNA ligase [Verrucomicrobia bacterium]|nr:proline--tRNA ligase [Verrucomicrobiota bacterium]